MTERRNRIPCMDQDCVCPCHLPLQDTSHVHPNQLTTNDYLGEHPPYLDLPHDQPEPRPAR
jgi:hypothetical protein